MSKGWFVIPMSKVEVGAIEIAETEQTITTYKLTVFVIPLKVLERVKLYVPASAFVAPFITTVVPTTFRKLFTGLRVGVTPQV